jgi:hypothetical protein
MEKIKIPYEDVEELAIHICGLNNDADANEIEEALLEEFEIPFDKFHELCEYLLPLVDVDEGWDGTLYKGFSKKEKDHLKWLVKTKIKPY